MTQQKKMLYSGKAKSVFLTDQEQILLLEFRDDTSAFDGKKIAKLQNKGAVNNQINTYIMQQLEIAGITTHLVKQVSANTALVKRLDMFPLEFVVRNAAAGSICRRLGLELGQEFEQPIFEIFLKNDDLGDPIVNECHIEVFEWATLDQIAKMKKITLEVNTVLKALFRDAGMILVDYKLEFGLSGDEIVLGDEFTPDGCRLWDIQTKESLDKDRFRQDLGDVIESYYIVANKIGIDIIS